MRSAAFLPPGTASSIPSQFKYALADDGRPAARARGSGLTRVTGIRRSGRARRGRGDRQPAKIETEDDRGRPVASTRLDVTPILINQHINHPIWHVTPSRGCPFRRCGTPTTSSTSAPGWAVWSARVTRSPGRSTASPKVDEAALLTEDRDRFEELSRTPSAACRRWRPRRSSASSTGPRPSRPTASSASAIARAGLLGRRRAFAPTASPAPAAWQGDGRVDRRRPARVRHLAHGPQAASAAHYAASATRSPAPRGPVQVLRHKYPAEERKSARPCGSPPPTPGSRSSAPCSARRPAGSGSTGSRATPPPATRRCAPRLGRPTGRPRSAPGPGDAWRRRPLRPVELRQARGARPGRDGVPGGARRQAGRPSRGLGRLHAAAEPARRHRVRPLSNRLGADRYLLVTGTAFGDHDRAWIERHLPPTAPSTWRRDVRAGVLLRVGPAGARHPAAAHAPAASPTPTSRTSRPAS